MMKLLSAAIVAHAGMTVFAASGLITHSDTQLFYAISGAGVALLGLAIWGRLLYDSQE